MPRLDLLLIEKKYFKSRTVAQAEIMAGNVLVNGQVANKPSFNVNDPAKIEIKKKDPYVSRGAHKLLKALDEFTIVVDGKKAIDAGTSTGGFAQVLLERGAGSIIAVDVGYGQFDYSLRQDKRIKLFERTNIRYFDSKSIEPVDIVVADLSFISITKVIENLINLSKNEADFVLLIKPQFEAEPKMLKKGVIRNAQSHEAILKQVVEALIEKGLSLVNVTFSPIKGPKGNIEFLAHFKKKSQSDTLGDLDKKVHDTVVEAHTVLI